jgi:Concanavalin A-like lectin/glucanases superfamily
MKLATVSVKSAFVFGSAVLCLLGPSAVVAADASGSATARSGSADRLRFNFDHGESLKPGTRVHDASGHGNNGTVRVSGNGHLTVLKNGLNGHSARYPAACKGCGRAIITAPSRPMLNPAGRAFSFGASVRVTPKRAPADRDPNILTKGSTINAKWKLHLLGAKPRCVFAGSLNEVVITSTTPIDNGQWHRVVCTRNGPVHRLWVDGKLKAQSKTVRSGKIISKYPVKVGARAVGHAGRNDQFHGDLDNVFLHIAKR